MKKVLFIFVLLIGVFFISNEPVTAQTTPTILEPGDVAIIGYNAYTDNSHQGFAITFLVDINPDTEISFTDYAWNDTDGVFVVHDNDGVLTWKSSRFYHAGEIVLLTWGSSNFYPFNSVGDQIFIFQGEYDNNPNLIFGININYLNWNGTYNDYKVSQLPSILINPKANLAIPFRNAVLTQEQTQFTDSLDALSYITNINNWIGDDSNYQIMPTIPLSIGPTSVVLDQFIATNKNEWIFPLVICLIFIVSLFIYIIIKEKKKFIF